MILTIKLENGTVVEIEELTSGPVNNSCHPAYDQEIEYVYATIIRNGKARYIHPDNAVKALERRLGGRWYESAKKTY